MTQDGISSHPCARGSKLALFAFGLAFIVILLGAFTRLTDAGLSCPDWPNCFGYITAPHTIDQLQAAAQKYPLTPVNVKKAWTEMTHRYVAGTEGILMLVLCFGVLFIKKIRTSATTTIGCSLIALLGVQVLLGMLTVTKNLKPVIVLSHLLTGISILCMLWLAFLTLTAKKNLQPIAARKPTLLKISLWIGFLIVAAQITLGGWVSTHYAGLACIDFPYCNGQLLPTLQWEHLNDDLITIHMLHRIGALVTAIYLITLSVCLLTPRNDGLRSLAITLLILITAQITLGIFNIIWLRPVWIAMLHQGVAIILLLTLIKALFDTGTRHVIRIP